MLVDLLMLPSMEPAHLLGVLDSLGCGGILLDIGGRILCFNMLAASSMGDGLVPGGALLGVIDGDTERRLQHLVEAALNTKGAHVPTSIAVQRSDRLPLVIRAVRLEEPTPRFSRSARLLLLVIDPERWPEPPHEMLSQAFGLTPAEAAVASGILSGRTLSGIAADRGVKVGTVRAHLKTVFSKTHTRGQADLTRVLTRLAVLLPTSERKIARRSS